MSRRKRQEQASPLDRVAVAVRWQHDGGSPVRSVRLCCLESVRLALLLFTWKIHSGAGGWLVVTDETGQEWPHPAGARVPPPPETWEGL